MTRFKRRLPLNLHLNLRILDRTEQFLAGLKGVTDPERKRKTIGRLFIKNFEAEAKKLKGIKHSGPGDAVPGCHRKRELQGSVGDDQDASQRRWVAGPHEAEADRTPAGTVQGRSACARKELGLPDDIIWRQPFPGPGLAIRVLGAVTKERLAILRAAETIVDQEIRSAGLYRDIWQAFAVLLPIRTVGVMGDQRTYEHVVAIRAVTSLDGMTADWAKIPADVLGRMSNRIINEVKGVNRVVYDISSKPPSTIEWE